MAMTTERVTERVAELIDAIRHSLSSAFAEHNAAQTLEYVEQLHQLGIIDTAQFQALASAVHDAADSWLPLVDPDGLPLTG